MASLAYLAALIPIVGIGVVVLFIVSVIQQSKTEHTGGFKQAFFTVVSMVMLATVVGSTIAVISTVSQRFIFTKAATTGIYRNGPPPTLFLPSGTVNKETGSTVSYTCTDKCQFTTDDKAQFVSWKQQYQDWQKSKPTDETQFRRDLVTPLSFLIVSLPLYFVFMRLMERGAKQELEALKKPTSLRSLYMYFLAFVGLLMVVFSTGWLINTGLKTVLKTNTNTNQIEAIPIGQTTGLDSVIACGSKCDFTETDLDLAGQGKTDYDTWQKGNQSNGNQVQTDLATQLPLLLVGFPLFWYHFARIRKETQDHPATPTPTLA